MLQDHIEFLGPSLGSADSKAGRALTISRNTCFTDQKLRWLGLGEVTASDRQELGLDPTFHGLLSRGSLDPDSAAAPPPHCVGEVWQGFFPSGR